MVFYFETVITDEELRELLAELARRAELFPAFRAAYRQSMREAGLPIPDWLND